MNAPFPSMIGRILTVCCMLMLCGITHQASAQKRTQRAASDTAQPEYIVLGHAQRRQQILRSNRAWTLGEDGTIIAWKRAKSDAWQPVAVRQFPDARAIAHDGEQLLAWTPDTILELNYALDVTTRERPTHAFACADGHAWRVDGKDRLCTQQDDQQLCSAESIDTKALQHVVCTRNQDQRCLSFLTKDGAQAWCTSPDALAFEGGSDAGYAVLHPQEHQRVWRIWDGEQWQAAESGHTGVKIPSNHDGLLPCFEGDSGHRCDSSAASDGPENGRISARTLRNILIAEHGFYFIFRDGWYGVHSDEAPSFDDVAYVHREPDGGERVWLQENVLRAQVEDGVARVSSCRETEEGATVIDRELHHGRTTVVHTSDDGCPKRAEYHEGTLHLSYRDRLLRWDILTEELEEAPVEMSIKNALSSSLIAEPSVSRHCSHLRWDVSFRTAFSGKIPIARDICARHAVTLPWHAATHEGDGAAIVLTGDFGSYLWLVHADSMTTHAIQTSEVIPAHTTIYRQEDGNYVLSDRRSGRSLILSPSGEVLDDTPMVFIGGRMWREEAGGVLASDDGHHLLVTDRGVILDGVGIGSITHRALTHDMRRVSARLALFSSQLRLLAQASKKREKRL